MSFTIFEASIPPMIRMLENLSRILDKAVAQAEAEHIDPASLLDGKLAPDMFALPRQIQITSDAAKGCAARLAGIEAPAMQDTETTFSELQHRIGKTIDFLKTVRPGQVEGAEDRTITVKLRDRSLDFSGRDYVNNWALPNFYFHVTTAYDILRHKGITVGKMDYLGG